MGRIIQCSGGNAEHRALPCRIRKEINKATTINSQTMKKLLTICLLLTIGTGVNAQSKEKVPIADETTASVTEKYYTIVCSNQIIADHILQIDKIEPRMLRYRVNFKKDRLGRYAEYSFVYNLEDKEYINGVFKELNKGNPK